MPLDALEKVELARAHKVAKWLRQGLSEIASEDSLRSASDLETRLGLSTAFRLLWILREQSHGRSEEYFTLRSVGCSGCGGALLKEEEDHECINCHRKLGLDDRNAVYCNGGLSASSDRGRPSKIVTNFDGSYLGCTSCSGCAVSVSPNCASCSAVVSRTHLRIRHRLSACQNLDSQINEVFASEIAEYETWDQ